MPMTNSEIWKAQQEARAAAAGRKTLPARLTDKACFTADGALAALLCEAATALQYYERTLAQVRKDMNDEIREGQRSAGAAYSDGRHDGMEEARGY